MRLKKLLVILTVFTLCIPAIGNAAGEKITSTQLIEQAKDWDGHTIEYRGEVIGDILNRGEYAWVSVMDDSNTISCYTKMQDAVFSNIGKYGVVGDKIKLVGVFNRACSDHGGDMDIHTHALTVVEQGYKVPMKFSKTLLSASLVLLAAAVLLIYLVFRKVK